MGCRAACHGDAPLSPDSSFSRSVRPGPVAPCRQQGATIGPEPRAQRGADCDNHRPPMNSWGNQQPRTIPQTTRIPRSAPRFALSVSHSLCWTRTEVQRRSRPSARVGGGGRNRIGRAVQPLGGRCKAGRSLRSRFWDVRSGERSPSAAGRPRTANAVSGRPYRAHNWSALRGTAPTPASSKPDKDI